MRNEMMRRFLNHLLLAILLLVWTRALAHDEFRIVGTVTKVQEFRVQVKTKGDKFISMRLGSGTSIHRDNDKAELKSRDLKVGQSVVVTAYGDDLTDLDALEIRIVPTIPQASAK